MCPRKSHSPGCAHCVARGAVMLAQSRALVAGGCQVFQAWGGSTPGAAASLPKGSLRQFLELQPPSLSFREQGALAPQSSSAVCWLLLCCWLLASALPGLRRAGTNRWLLVLGQSPHSTHSPADVAQLRASVSRETSAFHTPFEIN